jgi:hypothetical protein
MNSKIYNGCLSNSKNLNLRSVQLKFQGCKNIPSLTTIYELIHPIDIALDRVKKNIDELTNFTLGENAIMGLFALGYSSFEVLLGDLLNRILYFYPQKMTTTSNNRGNRSRIDYHVSKDALFQNEALKSALDNKIETIRYEDVGSILSKLQLYLSVNIKLTEEEHNQLVEIKETRNLLLHNALVVNDLYLTKTNKNGRAIKVNEKLTIDKNYSIKSLQLIYGVIEELNKQILIKYGKYTMLNLLDRLWNYTFKPHIKMKDYFAINQEKDIYDGPLKKGRIFLSSSEELLMDIWIAQRLGKGIRKFSLCLIDSDTIEKISFLTSVFGELKFTNW